ncbi:MAG TPA: histidine phosphatase family protein [Hypericibacter adhaerens]|jgi:broad specificity phosphatase PhoE|nr:histidine phosphatase family protein [Hypericibacter adhaerens]HWA41983.1 histidine phosphatase family protein [Hypericibacter adhaerens]
MAMILVRHGQSEFNVVYSKTRVDPGIHDPRLTEEGRQQARLAADRLAEHDLALILSSPYTRALQTAEIIAETLDLPVAIEPMVREHCRFHCDVGTLRSELALSWPALDFGTLPERWWHGGLDETEEEVVRRGHRFREQMAGHEAWSRIAVVTHWGFIRCLTGTQLGNGELLKFDPVQGQASLLKA